MELLNSVFCYLGGVMLLLGLYEFIVRPLMFDDDNPDPPEQDVEKWV